MNKSKIENRQAGTAADSSAKADLTTSSQTIGKPNVVCSILSKDILEKYSLQIKKVVKKYSIFYEGYKERCFQIATVYSKENDCSLELSIMKLSAYQLDEESSLLFLSILT